MQIQWYPGHMTKTRRMLADNLKLIDVVIELVDARAPLSTRNPDFDDLFAGKTRIILLNKSDLANKQATAAWIKHFRSEGIPATSFTATLSGKRAVALSLIEEAAKETVEKYRKKGVNKTVRAMIVGIPNVGKSTLINTVARGVRANVGNRPGVTRGRQWVSINSYLELMDTPGMLWPKFEDETVARHIAYIGSVRDEILDIETLAENLLADIIHLSGEDVMARYKCISSVSKESLLEQVCESRGFRLAGGEYDTMRGARTVLDEFRAGKIARITLEVPNSTRVCDDIRPEQKS